MSGSLVIRNKIGKWAMDINFKRGNINAIKKCEAQ